MALDDQGAAYITWQDQQNPSSEIFVRANTFTINRVFVVDEVSDISLVLENNNLGAGDVIQVAPGSTMPGFELTRNDAGVAILGAPDGSTRITGPVSLAFADDSVIRGITFEDSVTVSSSEDIIITENTFTGNTGLILNNASGLTISTLGFDPLAYYSLDEANGTVAQDGIGTFDGTIDTGVTLNQAGESVTGGTSALFDGTSNASILLGNDSDLQSNSGTVVAWIKTSNAGSSYRAIVVKEFAYGIFCGITYLPRTIGAVGAPDQLM